MAVGEAFWDSFEADNPPAAREGSERWEVAVVPDTGGRDEVRGGVGASFVG